MCYACVPGTKQTLYLSVHLNHSHTGSYDFWIVRFVAIWPRCDRSAMSAAISSGGWSLTIGRTRGGAITNDWRRWMARSVVGNRATSGSDHRFFRRSIIASDDRSYDQSWCRVTDRSINRGVRRRVARTIVASCDRSHNQSWRAATDRTINRCVRREIARPSWHLRPIVRLVVPPVAKSCDKSGQVSNSRFTERDVVQRVAPPIVRWHDQLHDQSCHCVIRDNPQLVMRPHTTGGTIT